MARIWTYRNAFSEVNAGLGLTREVEADKKVVSCLLGTFIEIGLLRMMRNMGCRLNSN